MYQVNLIGLLVKDIVETIDFYKRIFDFRVINQKSTNPKGDSRAFIKGGNTVIELTQLADGNPGNPEGAICHIGFFVNNLKEEIERLNKLGIQLESGIKGHIPINRIQKVANGEIFYFRGINGESIGLIQLNENNRLQD